MRPLVAVIIACKYKQFLGRGGLFAVDAAARRYTYYAFQVDTV